MTKKERVLAYLKEAGDRGITPLDAWRECGSYRLGAVIFELKKEGWVIETEIETYSGKFGTSRFARYTLKQEEQQCFHFAKEVLKSSTQNSTKQSEI